MNNKEVSLLGLVILLICLGLLSFYFYSHKGNFPMNIEQQNMKAIQETASLGNWTSFMVCSIKTNQCAKFGKVGN